MLSELKDPSQGSIEKNNTAAPLRAKALILGGKVVQKAKLVGDSDIIIPQLFSCYIHKFGKWEELKFKDNNKPVRIGSSPDCEIHVPAHGVADEHAIVQKLGNGIIIVERKGNKDNRFNGHKQTQFITGKYSACIMTIKDIPIIFSTTVGNRFLLADPLETQSLNYRIISSDNEYSLSRERSVLIGSHPACGIKAKNQDFYGLIYYRGNRLCFFPLSNSVTVDGKPTDSVAFLQHGSVIKAGNEFFSLSLPEALRTAPKTRTSLIAEKKQFCLLAINPEQTPDKVVLPELGKAISLGRSEKNYISIPTPDISRVHANLLVQDDYLLVTDCESANGTRHNGKRIVKAEVRPGDSIDFADKRFILCYTD